LPILTEYVNLRRAEPTAKSSNLACKASFAIPSQTQFSQVF
jgi:hypothetical protein